jgi:hypothetical protein
MLFQNLDDFGEDAVGRLSAGAGAGIIGSDG